MKQYDNIAISHVHSVFCKDFYIDELKKVLTRVKDGAKVIVLGHTGQIDIVKHPEYSGFSAYIDLFKDYDRCAVCELTQNFRGWVSRVADSLDIDKIKQEADNSELPLTESQWLLLNSSPDLAW